MNCIICCNIVEKEMVCMNCNCKNSIYHNRCLQEWLNIKRCCPTCLKEFKERHHMKRSHLDKLRLALYYDSIGKYSKFLNIQNKLSCKNKYTYYI